MTTIPWIVDLPPNDVDITGISRASFIRACQGHEKMGDLLSYFILIASHVAKDQRIDTTAPDCTFIDISCKFENIIKKVNISRKSLGNYVKQLESLGYVEAPAYQRVYRIHFKKINAAIKSPPEEVKAKPRGKYAPPTVKPTQEEKDEQKRLVLQHKLVKLQHKLVNLQTKMVTLHKELVNLPTLQTDESTPQADVEDIFDPLRTIQNSLEPIRDILVASPLGESDEGASAFLEKIISFKETLEEVRAQEDGKALLDPPSYRREEKEPEGLPRVVALLTPTTPEPTQKDTVSLSTDGRMMRTPTQMSTQPPTEEEPTQNTVIPVLPVPSLSLEDAAKTPSPNKTDGKGKNKKVEPVPLCSSRTIRESIDALRGYALDQEGPMKHERGVIKEWCQKHTLEDYKLVVEHCTKGHCTNKEHQFWREGTNLASFFNADKLAKLTPGVLACTGHVPKPNAPPEVAPKAEKKVAEWHPVDVITPRKGVEVYYPATGERYRNGQRIAQ